MLYTAILRRNPSFDEIIQRTKMLRTNRDIKSHIIDIINSDEFSVMILPYLVQKKSNLKSNQKLFFLHVPKTSGTSLRLMLSNYLGIPAYLLYHHNGLEGVEKYQNMKFWPFWAGHANISRFPNSHNGFTSFRETRSRLISTYRQNLSNLTPHLNLRENSGEFLSDYSRIYLQESKNFNGWLKKFGSSICHYYVPNNDSIFSKEDSSEYEKFKDTMGTSLDWVRKIDSSDESWLVSSIQHSMKRFQAAAWVGDNQSLSDSIIKLFGEENRNLALPKVNVFVKTSNYQLEVISKQSVEIMEEIARKDRIVFENAMNEGILSERIPFNPDEVFSETKERLGFV